MICHGELERLKPNRTRQTLFYTAVSAGGALGGAFVVLVAPLLFPDWWEFYLALWGACALTIFTVLRDPNSWWYSRKHWGSIALLVFAFAFPEIAGRFIPAVGAVMNSLNQFHVVECCVVVALLITSIARRQFRPSLPNNRICALTTLFLYGLMFVSVIRWQDSDHVIVQVRNFFGVLRVQQDESLTLLIHGGTYQGAQFRDGGSRRQPTTYYGHSSGIGLLLDHHPKRNLNEPIRIGVVGLGVGTLAAYGRPGDYMRFYEIDPDILRLSAGSHPQFTYLADSSARCDVVAGDGRLSLESEATSDQLQHFDVLVIDAFHGDAVPVHLLTKEAARIYLQQIDPDGVLAFHVTNASLDLVPVTLGLGREFGLSALLMRTNDSGVEVHNEWVMLSRNRQILNMLQLLGSGKLLDSESRSDLWTDDYSDVWRLMLAKFEEHHD
jgi:hypothetical protein